PAMSPPAPNHLSVPVKQTASSSASRSAQMAARFRARYMSWVKALRRSTLSMRRCSTRSLTDETMNRLPKSGALLTRSYVVDGGGVVVEDLCQHVIRQP